MKNLPTKWALCSSGVRSQCPTISDGRAQGPHARTSTLLTALGRTGQLLRQQSKISTRSRLP